MHTTLLYKKFLCVFMSLMIVILSTQSAYANTSLGGWTVTDSVIAGVNTTINATKTSASGALKSAITVAPNALKVGGFLLRGGAVGALAMAIPQLIGEGVDYVLDPANNSIQYSSPVDPAAVVSVDFTGQYIYKASDSPYRDYANPTAACDTLIYANNGAGIAGATFSHIGDIAGNRTMCYYSQYGVLKAWSWSDRRINPNYNPDAPPAYDKSIPIADVSSQVIANAEAGHPESQEVLKTVAIEGFVAGDYDADLEAAAVPDTSAGTGTGTISDPATSTSDPALTGISAILASILSAFTGFADWWEAQWTTFSTAITDFNTWVRAEPDTASLQPEPVEVTDGTLVAGWEDKVNAGYVNLGGAQCPNDVLIPISYMGASTNLSISYVPFCHFASIIRYAVILGAWVAALMIISGGRTRE